MTADDDRTVPFLDLHGAAFQRDPHGVLRWARERSFWAPTAIGSALLRYEEVQAALCHRKLRTPGADFLAMQGITDGPLFTTMQSFLLSADGAAHEHMRRAVSKAFMGCRVEQFRPAMAAIARDLVDAMTQRERCDFIEDFADPFAFRVLCAFIGIPEDTHAIVRAWTGDIALIFGLGVAENGARITAALGGLNAYIDELLADRRRAPRDDLVSALVAAGEAAEPLTPAQIRSLVLTLMSAGHDTVRHQLGNAMAAFLDHPEQWRMLAAQPELSAQAAHEVVRFSPASILGLPRVAAADIELCGLPFARGDWILPITGSANRDPRVFASPDSFDIARPRSPHLSFGGGIHFCLGAALARVELQVALPILASRLHEISAAGQAPWRPPTEAVYGPVRLPIAYRAAPT